MGRGKRGKKTKKTGRGEGSQKRTKQRRKKIKLFFPFKKKRRVAASKARGLFHFSARGEATAYLVFPSDRQRLSYLTERGGKAERARERSEEIKKKGKGNEMFPLLSTFCSPTLLLQLLASPP